MRRFTSTAIASRGNDAARCREPATASSSEAGCTVPDGSFHGASASFGSPSCRRLETICPWIGSAGWDAYHATTLVLSAFWDKMFQSAFAFREVLALTRNPLPSGFGSTKFRMPCLSAVFPVAIELHSRGESFGSRVVRFARTPRASRPWRKGIFPAAKSGSSINQSAASQPMKSSLRAERSAMRGSYRMRRIKRGESNDSPRLSLITRLVSPASSSASESCKTQERDRARSWGHGDRCTSVVKGDKVEGSNTHGCTHRH